MAVELDRVTFKHLVQLYVVSGLAELLALAPQYLMGRWAEFSDLFDALVAERFGTSDRPLAVLIALLIAAAAAFAWHVASIVGLFHFRAWARSGLWLSLVCLFAVYVLTVGFRPVFSSPFDDGFAAIDGALFGGIVVLAYGNGLGSEWFGKQSALAEE